MENEADGRVPASRNKSRRVVNVHEYKNVKLKNTSKQNNSTIGLFTAT